jgi:hypothetical protein
MGMEVQEKNWRQGKQGKPCMARELFADGDESRRALGFTIRRRIEVL